MLLAELKKLLEKTSDRSLRIQLANGNEVPVHFHVTEVGQVSKTFIDCGGTARATTSCVIQTWLGSDVEHRLSSEKFSKILRMSESIIPVDQLPVEVEYEQGVISQYPLTGAKVTDAEIVLELGLKHTDCLAKEACGVPQNGTISISAKAGCC